MVYFSVRLKANLIEVFFFFCMHCQSLWLEADFPLSPKNNKKKEDENTKKKELDL